MEKISAYFKFNKVGQGCFYNGRISVSKKVHFNFVYDCGSHSTRDYLYDEIEKYKEKYLSQKMLNMLIISHFDEDHVNGIWNLLENIHCQVVIMPYLFPIERLLLYIAYYNDNNSLKDDPDDNYRQFLLDPIKFLFDKFEIERIILIGGSDKDNFDKENIKNPNLPVNNEFNESFKNWYVNINDEEDIELRDKVFDNEKINDDHKSKLKFINQTKAIYLYYLWEFRFLHWEFRNSQVIKFEKTLDEYLKKKIFNTKRELFTEENRKEIREIYRKHFNRLNSTSLVVYHAPLQANFNKLHTAICINYPYYSDEYFYNDDFPPCNCCFKHSHSGTLLTGDSDLKAKIRHDRLYNYFNDVWENIYVFQVPHHGSKYNWYKKRDSKLLKFDCYIINYGLGNKHKHPSESVVDQITKSNERLLFLNSQTNSLCYSIFNINY